MTREAILVACPRCAAPAQARGVRYEELRGHWGAQLAEIVRVTCPACGLSREGRRVGWGFTDGFLELSFGHDASLRLDRRIRAHRRWPRARCERFPFWLRAPCCGDHVLWAFNAEHLDELDAFVRAPLRTTWGYRLPRWIVEAKHRDEVLHTIARLRASLAAAAA
jgi:endogenous inhibitor of DNA gyrase (YacG/DUF329 family)